MEVERRKDMSTLRVVMFAFVTSIALLVAVGTYGQGKYVEKVNEELYGTWSNQSYRGISDDGYLPQKVVIIQRTYTDFSMLADAIPSAVGNQEVTGKWQDAEGNVWYKIRGTGTSGGTVFKFVSLQKLSKSATVRELVAVLVGNSSSESYPARIDPTDTSYRIYYRTKE
jgi:hypothetical protein